MSIFNVHYMCFIMFVLFNALSRRVGALQSHMIIIISDGKCLSKDNATWSYEAILIGCREVFGGR